MLDKQRCPLSRQEQKLECLIVEDGWIRPRGNAHGFNAINEFTNRKKNIFRVHIMEEEVG